MLGSQGQGQRCQFFSKLLFQFNVIPIRIIEYICIHTYIYIYVYMYTHILKKNSKMFVYVWVQYINSLEKSYKVNMYVIITQV